MYSPVDGDIMTAVIRLTITTAHKICVVSADTLALPTDSAQCAPVDTIVTR